MPAAVQAASGSNVYISDLDVLTEYVKITNTGWNSVVMTGWRLTNKDGSNIIQFIEWTNPDGSTFNYELRGHSTVTIYSPEEGSPTSSSLYWPQEMWYDEGDTAYLYDSSGTLVSTYSSAGTGPTTVPTTVPTTTPTQVPAGTGTLSVTSTPSGAMVFLDGVFRGITPISMTGVSPGTHQLRMHRTGYNDYSTSVTVLAGQTVVVPAVLAPSSSPTPVPTTVPTTAPTQVPTGTGTGTLSVTSTPGGAMVFLDGAYKGLTPVTIAGVSPGPHQLRMHRTGYNDYSASVTVLAGQTVVVPAVLAPSSGPTPVPTTVPTTTPTQVPTGTGTGTLSVTSIPGSAMVFLDGVFRGITPISMTGVSPGTHQLRMHRTGYNDYSTSVTVLAGQTVVVPAVLTPSSGPTPVPTTVPTTAPTQVPTGTGTGALSVTSTPGSAMVFLDGAYKGLTPVTITGVSSGTHQLTMHRIGYQDYSASVTVLAGQIVPVIATLTPSSGPTMVPTTVPTTTPTQVPAGTGTLSITSAPAGATVYLDSTAIGTTPLTVSDVPAGSHRISIRKSMYRNYSTRVMVNPDETTTVSVTLHHIWEGINPFS